MIDFRGLLFAEGFELLGIGAFEKINVPPFECVGGNSEKTPMSGRGY